MDSHTNMTCYDSNCKLQTVIDRYNGPVKHNRPPLQAQITTLVEQDINAKLSTIEQDVVELASLYKSSSSSKPKPPSEEKFTVW